MFGEKMVRIRDSVLESCRTESGLFQIIACEDGGYQIAVNGEPIACFYWKQGELESCQRTFVRLCNDKTRSCA